MRQCEVVYDHRYSAQCRYSIGFFFILSFKQETAEGTVETYQNQLVVLVLSVKSISEVLSAISTVYYRHP